MLHLHNRAESKFGFDMIRNITVKNFRGFQSLSIGGVAPINLLLGDNGVGKTAILEAVFLALGGTPELALRYRAMRGLDMAFSGTAQRIEEVLIRDLFYKGDWSKPIEVTLDGKGREGRSVFISKATGHTSVPLDGSENFERTAPVRFLWKDHKGEETERNIIISGSQLNFTGTDPDLPDFFLFPANQTPPSRETADRFSDLSKAGGRADFVKTFTKEYKFLSDLRLETQSSQAAIFGVLRDSKEMYPLGNISGGINRVISILLAMAGRENGVVLIDEFENGIYYKHYEAISRIIIRMARTHNSQIFISTHSIEWIEAFFRAAGKDVKDINVWRLERRPNGISELLKFSGEASAVAVWNGEIR